jgi:hypothetical protein
MLHRALTRGAGDGPGWAVRALLGTLALAAALALVLHRPR